MAAAGRAVSTMIEVRLDPEEWQRVLAILSQAPWATVNPLIMKIGEQLRAHSAAEGARRGNGVDEEAAQGGRPA
jgi:hypothetical protein